MGTRTKDLLMARLGRSEAAAVNSYKWGERGGPGLLSIQLLYVMAPLLQTTLGRRKTSGVLSVTTGGRVIGCTAPGRRRRTGTRPHGDQQSSMTAQAPRSGT